MHVYLSLSCRHRQNNRALLFPSFSDWSTDVGVKASPYRCLLQIKTHSGWSEWTTQVWMSEFMCCATVCCEAMKIILIVNLSKTKESSTLSEVLLQICLIIFMFQYFCVSLITMQQIITHSHSWIVYIVSSTISWLFKIVTKKKYKNWLLFWWRWVFFFTPQCLLWWCRWLCHVPFPWKCLFCELTV